MMNIVKFTKMHGAGNDFILVDDRDANFPVHDHRRIAMMATRRVGVGCEGVIILQKSLVCDFKMMFFNPDGTEAELCGNGARCIAAFAVEIGAVRGRKMRFETAAGEIEAEVVADNLVKIVMPAPVGFSDDFVVVGVPHKIVLRRQPWRGGDERDGNRAHARLRKRKQKRKIHPRYGRRSL